jgi:CHAD domain-containing protein
MTKSATAQCVQMLLQSINNAIGCLEKPGPISDEEAHDVRKALKKARAALRLLRSAIGDVAYRRENVALRNASRSISPLREARAQVDSIRLLRERHLQRSASGWIELESKARGRLERMRKRLRGNSSAVLKATRLMSASKTRLNALQFRAGGRKDLDVSLRKIYRKSSKAFAVAKRRPSTISLHEWRRKAKYFANAVDMLGRHVSPRASALARKADRLADWLGEEHDLAGLADALHDENSGLRSPLEMVGLRKALDARRVTLRRKALRLGKTLHAKRPKVVMR